MVTICSFSKMRTLLCVTISFYKPSFQGRLRPHNETSKPPMAAHIRVARWLLCSSEVRWEQHPETVIARRLLDGLFSDVSLFLCL